ncbi:MAG: hypothetical protein U0936_27255 [Planctomycetaceae bacterium]
MKQHTGSLDVVLGAAILSLSAFAGCQSSSGLLKSTESCTEPAPEYGRGSSGEVGHHSGQFWFSGQNSGRGSSQECRGNGDDGVCKRNDTIDRAAVPAPHGTYVSQWNDAMICSARQQQLLISRHEWFSGGNELGPEGREHVLQLSELMKSSGYLITIELEPVHLDYDETFEEATARTVQLNEQRREFVVQLMNDSGVADADQRVFLLPSNSVGVRGVEAPRVYNRLLFGGQGGGGGGNQNGEGNMGAGQGMGAGGGGFGGGGIF